MGLEKRIGSIAPGMNADLVVIPEVYRDPYTALLSTEPADVKLTVVNGRPLYGEPALMNRFPFLESMEDITIGERAKKIALSIRSHAIDESDKPLAAVVNDLRAAYEASDPKICNFLPYDSCSSSPVLDVTIDINPESDPNVINLSGNGIIPVAILTTTTFDATTVTPLSVRFGPGEARNVNAGCDVADVDGDGDLDVVLHFRTQETGITNGQTQAVLVGQTCWGQRILGTDPIQTMGRASRYRPQ